MRNLSILGTAALILALGVASASATGQSGPTNADLLGQRAMTQSAPSNASGFEAHENGDVSTTVIHHAGR